MQASFSPHIKTYTYITEDKFKKLQKGMTEKELNKIMRSEFWEKKMIDKGVYAITWGMSTRWKSYSETAKQSELSRKIEMSRDVEHVVLEEKGGIHAIRSVGNLPFAHPGKPMQCYVCGDDAQGACTRCGQFHCPRHGGFRRTLRHRGRRGLCDHCTPNQTFVAWWPLIALIIAGCLGLVGYFAWIKPNMEKGEQWRRDQEQEQREWRKQHCLPPQ